MKLGEVVYFESPRAFRAWLTKHHVRATEVWVGFHKRATGRPSMTWPESVDEALCFGWIDGIRKSIDEDRYVIRFTPRKKTSNWSAINVKRVAELTKLGRMKKAGLDAFAHRKEKKTGIYTHEQRTTAKLDPEAHKKLERDAKAWAFFQSQPAWYRKAAVWWVVSAKQEETRERRLSTLISDSARGRTIPPLTRKPSSIESK